jgi:hypothetical protein
MANAHAVSFVHKELQKIKTGRGRRKSVRCAPRRRWPETVAARYWVRAAIKVRWASSTSRKLNLPISKPRVAASTALGGGQDLLVERAHFGIGGLPQVQGLAGFSTQAQFGGVAQVAGLVGTTAGGSTCPDCG